MRANPSTTTTWVASGYKALILELLNHTPFSQGKTKALSKINRTFYNNECERIYSFVTQDAIKGQNYSAAQAASLLSDDINSCIKLLEEWSSQGLRHEKPLFITRYILL